MFEFFDEQYQAADDSRTAKSLQQLVFEDRLKLAQTALDLQKQDAFDLATRLILEDIKSLDENQSIDIRGKWRDIKLLQKDGVIRQFAPATRALLNNDIAPLMKWRNITGYQEAYLFDRLCCQLQHELVTGGSQFNDLKDDLLNQVHELPINLNAVRAKIATINQVNSGAFWTQPTVESIETVRVELRGVMKYRQNETGSGQRFQPKVIDIAEEDDLIESKDYQPKIKGLQLIEYRHRVQAVLEALMESSPALQKIRLGEPVSETELKELAALVVAQEPDLKLEDLADYFPQAGSIEAVIRGIVGLDADQVGRRFSEFIKTHTLNSTQLRFLDLLKTFIARHGKIEVSDLYEDPFTSLNPDGIDGVFDDSLADELIILIQEYQSDTDDNAEVS